MGKSQCKINWSQYNKGLINRGNNSMVFGRYDKKLKSKKENRRGRLAIYSNEVIFLIDRFGLVKLLVKS